MSSWPGLLSLVGAILVLGLIIGLLVRRWRRAGVDVDISLTLTFSALFAALSVIGAGITLANLLTAAQLSVTIPVREYWPTPPEGVEIATSGATATRLSGGFTSADLVVEGASSGARWLWASGQTLAILVPAAVAALIAIACFQLLRGRAFAPVVYRTAMVTALVVLVAGMGAQALSEFGASLISAEVLDISGATVTGAPEGWDVMALLPQSAMHMTIPLWPLGAAAGFAALGAILKAGARLQRDTEGLV